jgi:RNA polymerase sigma factor (sigma-70 family)
MNIAEDLLHEVFITAINKYETYTGKGSFEGWLYRIAVNTALMYLRKERKIFTEAWNDESLLSVQDYDDTDRDDAEDVKSVVEAARFSSEELIFAIDKLPEHHKIVFNMYVMDGFSHKQIAAELNISQGTSKSHLARARKKIQQFLYEEAMNRAKKKERRRASLFLLLFPAKEHYIDRMFRKGLSDFAIPPTGDTTFLSSVIERHAATEMTATMQSAHNAMQISSATHNAASITSQTAFWGGKISYIAACCGTAAITGTVCWFSMSVNSPLNSDNDKINNEIFVSDTVNYSPSLIEEEVVIFDETDSSSNFFMSEQTEVSEPEETFSNYKPENSKNIDTKDDEAAEKTTPVVVTKQIIERQTVVVRDTIIIVE